MSSNSSTTQSSTAPPLRTYGPRSMLVMAALCGFIGFFFWLSTRLMETPEPPAKDKELIAEREAGAGTESTTTPNKKRPATTTGASNDPADKRDAQIQELKQLHEKVAAQLEALRTQATSAQIDQDRFPARVSELRRVGDEIAESLETLKTERTEWSVQCAGLMTNDRGRQIAADPAQLALLAGLLDRQPISQTTITGWQAQLDRQLRTIRSADLDRDDTVAISAGLLEELNGLRQTIREALVDLRQQRAALKGILAAASSVQPGSDTPSLQKALESYRNQLAVEREEFLSKAAKRIRDELTTRLIEEQQRTETEIGEKRIADEKRLRDQKAKEAEANTQIAIQMSKDREEDARRAEARRQAVLAAKRKREDLERDFAADMPKIKHYLIPFIAEGYSQPDFKNQKRNVGKKGPVSLSELQAQGCLIDGIEGLTSLNAMALHDGNDRPNGAFRRKFGGGLAPQDSEFVQVAQKLLIKYGEIMVEQGILAP